MRLTYVQKYVDLLAFTILTGGFIVMRILEWLLN